MPILENEELKPGDTFGRFSIVRKLGQGGMGAVYEAVHSGLKKRVAIKTLYPQMAKNPDLLARFVREGEAASRLRHPNVVDITDVGTDQGVAYLVMEYLEGEDLSKLMKREHGLSPERLADLMLPVFSAVAAAHDQGIVHRDLKPANIYLVQTIHGLQPKLLDFGISKIDDAAGADLTRTAAVLGTAGYMSPEQALGARNADARSDQYSLGVILYEAATGHRPFGRAEGESSMYRLLHAIVQGEFERPRTVKPEIPEAFEQVILRAMAREASHRFATVRGLGAAMLPFANPTARGVWSPQFAGAAEAPATMMGTLAGAPSTTAFATSNQTSVFGSPSTQATVASTPLSSPGTVALTPLANAPNTLEGTAKPAPARSSGGTMAIVALAVVGVGLAVGAFAIFSRRAAPTPAVQPAPMAAVPAGPLTVVPVIPTPVQGIAPTPTTPPAVATAPVAQPIAPTPAAAPPTVPAVPATPTPATPEQRPATATPTASGDHPPPGAARPATHRRGPRPTPSSDYYIP